MSKHSAARKCSHLETRQATHKLNVISCWWVPVRMLCREQDHLDGKLAQGCIHFPNIIPSPAWSPSQFTGILVISDFFTTCCLTKALSLYFFDMKMPTFCPRHFGNLRQVTWLIVLLCSCPALSLQSGKEESLKTYSLRSVEVDPCNFEIPQKHMSPFYPLSGESWRWPWKSSFIDGPLGLRRAAWTEHHYARVQAGTSSARKPKTTQGHPVSSLHWRKIWTWLMDSEPTKRNTLTGKVAKC